MLWRYEIGTESDCRPCINLVVIEWIYVFDYYILVFIDICNIVTDVEIEFREIDQLVVVVRCVAQIINVFRWITFYLIAKHFKMLYLYCLSCY